MGLLGKFFRPGINAQVAKAQEDPNAVLLDVRSRQEYAQGHIEGAVNVPLDEIERAAELYAGNCLYVYCASGARSKRAVAALKAAGVGSAENIGGIMSWRGPLVTED